MGNEYEVHPVRRAGDFAGNNGITERTPKQVSADIANAYRRAAALGGKIIAREEFAGDPDHKYYVVEYPDGEMPNVPRQMRPDQE